MHLQSFCYEMESSIVNSGNQINSNTAEQYNRSEIHQCTMPFCGIRSAHSIPL